MSAINWLERASAATNLAVSSDEPPPTPITMSAPTRRAKSTASSTSLSGGSATTWSKTWVEKPVSFRLATIGASRPERTKEAKVTISAERAEKREATSAPSLPLTPHSLTSAGAVSKVNENMLSPR